MVINSDQKGRKGEREFAKLLREELGIAARRGQQYTGSPGSPDVVTDIPGTHFEVKRVECFRLYQALEQAKADSGPGEIPLVAHRKNGEPWVFIIRALDTPDFAKRFLKAFQTLEPAEASDFSNTNY